MEMEHAKIGEFNGTIVRCRDGTPLQLTMSGNGNAPDKQGGQHTNCSTCWYRVLKEENGVYVPVTEFLHLSSRSMVRSYELITISDTLEEFQQLMEEF